jgi:type I restriction enzyme S subunit
MPSERSVYQLGDVVDFISGGTPDTSSPAYWNGDIPWVSAKDLKSFYLWDSEDHITQAGAAAGTRFARAGSTLLLVRGMTLLDDVPICVPRRDLTFNQDIKALVARCPLEPSYLPYFLLWKKPTLLAKVDLAGHGTGRLNTDELKRLEIALPSQLEQQRIAQILGALDDKIELNRRMNETLEAIARRIFKSWFIDFDPVRANADERDCGASDMFPASFVSYGGFQIPKGWTLATIADIADLNARTLGASDRMEEIDYVEISEVSRGDIGSIMHYKRGEEPSRARRRVVHGDSVLSTVRPERASFFLALNPPETLIVSTGFVVLSPSTVPWSFLHLVTAQREFFDELGRLADGGAYPAIRPQVIAAQSLVVPDARVLSRFHEIAAPLLEKVDSNRKESRTLATIRDTVLPKLLSGELTPRAVEHHAAEAL